jgi:oligosaccharide translocation protein RFT1
MSVKFQRQHDDFTLHSWLDLLPGFYPSQSFINIERARLALSFFFQSFLKQLLTEGERYVMTLFAILSFGEQGIYDVINNLGSLVARFIFQPVEESFYVYFAHTLQRGIPYYQQQQSNRHVASETLFMLLKFASLVGYTILVFGYSYSYLLLYLYGGDKFTEGSGH